MPPFIGVAVNVSAIPIQIVGEEGDIETLTGSGLFTIIEIVLEVAGFPVAQVRLEVISQTTLFPFAGMYVKDGLFVP